MLGLDVILASWNLVGADTWARFAIMIITSQCVPVLSVRVRTDRLFSILTLTAAQSFQYSPAIAVYLTVSRNAEVLILATITKALALGLRSMGC